MQNITSWKDSLTTNTSVTACDIRDESKYKVAKLADGKVWMQDNLSLGSTMQTYHLTDSDTNLETGTTYDLPQSTTGSAWQDSYVASYINADYKTTVPIDATSTAGNYKIGVYYNYCAAVAGTICTNTTQTQATYDICPKGWRLPIGGTNASDTSNEFSILARAIYGSTGSTSDPTAYANYRAALHLPISGGFRSGSAVNQGSYGDWWSTTASSDTNRYTLSIDTSVIVPANLNGRQIGRSIRCIAR